MAITNFNFPRVTVNQQFTGTGVSTDAALPVCVIGPEYAVKTYAKYGEQLLVGEFGGTYESISYPGNAAKDIVDPASVSLFVKDTFVQLFNSQTVTGTKFVTPTGLDGKSELNKLVCMRAPEAEGGADVSVALRSGNGFTRDTAVATNITTGDIVRIADAQYTISAVERSTDGKYAVLVLAKALPEAVTDAVATIQRKTSISIAATNPTTQKLTCPATATIDLVNSEGVIVHGLKITGGTLYAEYSVRVLRHVNVLGSVAAGQGMHQALNDVFKGLTNDNPLGQGVYAACTTAGDTMVYFTAVAEDTVQAYAEAMDFIDGKDMCYNCVILSQDADVIKTCLAYANAQSDAESPNPKIIWTGLSNPECVEIAHVAQYSVATTEDVTTITLVSGAIPGVVKGDYIRWKSGTTVFGAPAYAEAEIAAVNADELTITEADLSTLPEDFAIVRKSYSKLDLVNHLITSKCVADRRATVVYADDAVFGGQVVPGYIAAACAAGMRASEQPHRPLSNMAYAGLTVLDTHGLSLSNLKTLGANGIWLIANNAAGIAVNKRQVTSAAADDINFDEQSLTTNVDSFIQVVKHVGQDMVGNSNISPSLLQVLRIRLHNILSAFTTYVQSAQVGPQLLSAELQALYQDSVNLDTVFADIVLDPPKPFNRLHIRVRLA